MHGIGNDFIVVNAMTYVLPEESLSDLSRRANDRKFGIGGDGLVLVLPSKVADYRMRMFNPDGSEAEMCGNGIRCFAKYLYDRMMITEKHLNVETKAGTKSLRLEVEEGKAALVSVDMGTPVTQRSLIPMKGEPKESAVIGEPLKVDGQKYEITAVNMGNPHVVIFQDNVDNFPVAKIGPLVENHPHFPERTNVHFVQVCTPTEVVIRTWERGAGLTLACGTGACASVVACVMNNKTHRNVTTHLPGGDLRIEYKGDERVIMTGPAEEVFQGNYPF